MECGEESIEGIGKRSAVGGLVVCDAVDGRGLPHLDAADDVVARQTKRNELATHGNPAHGDNAVAAGVEAGGFKIDCKELHLGEWRGFFGRVEVQLSTR